MPVRQEPSSLQGRFRLDSANTSTRSANLELDLNQEHQPETELVAPQHSSQCGEQPDGSCKALNPCNLLTCEKCRVSVDVPDRTSPKLIVMPGAHRIDPFNVLPAPTNARTETLMMNFVDVKLPPWCPVNPTTSWFSYALEDTSLFHATLFLSSGFEACAKIRSGRVSDVTSIMEQKAKAIQSINVQLSSSSTYLSDALIAAVALLANHEVTFGSLEESVVHMNGLEQMVRLRGGLHTLGMDGLLQRAIHWTDQCHAAALSSAPRFWLPEDTNPSRLDISDTIVFEPIPIYYSVAITPSPSTLLPNIQDLLENIFRGIPQLSATLASTSRTYLLSAAAHRTTLSDDLTLIERRLMFSQDLRNLTNHMDAAYKSLHQSCRLGVLLFVLSMLKGFTLTAVWYGKLVTELQMWLSQGNNLLSVWHSVPHLLFWILYVGATTANGRPERVWFVAELANLSVVLELQDWNSAKQILKQTCWLEKNNESDLVLWQEVVAVLS